MGRVRPLARSSWMTLATASVGFAATSAWQAFREPQQGAVRTGAQGGGAGV